MMQPDCWGLGLIRISWETSDILGEKTKNLEYDLIRLHFSNGHEEEEMDFCIPLPLLNRNGALLMAKRAEIRKRTGSTPTRPQSLGLGMAGFAMWGKAYELIPNDELKAAADVWLNRKV
jgi:hypothetical protein